jgi:hypothetical protein
MYTCTYVCTEIRGAAVAYHYVCKMMAQGNHVLLVRSPTLHKSNKCFHTSMCISFVCAS